VPSALETARSRYAAGDLAGAAAAAATLSPPDSAALDVIGNIRADAARATESARTRADKAGAARTPAYQNASRKEAEAKALTGPPDIGRAVEVYKAAEIDFAAAAAVAAEADQLVRSAGDALRKGGVAAALKAVDRAVALNPGVSGAADALASIRSRAQSNAMDARTEAVRLGAEAVASFKEGDAVRAGAEADGDPRQTRRQVAGFDRATVLYNAAAAEMPGRRSQAQLAVAAGRAALERGDLDGAERSLNDAVSAYSAVDGAAPLKTAIDAARRKPATEAPSAARLAVERKAIVETLQAYANAHANLRVEDVVKVAPFLAGPAALDLAEAFKNYRKYSMRIEGGAPTFSSDATRAVARCTITRNIVTRSGQEPRQTAVVDIILQKTGNQWIIAGIQNPAAR
jgi:hypothetical protein